jgi:hypothetical protein
MLRKEQGENKKRKRPIKTFNIKKNDYESELLILSKIRHTRNGKSLSYYYAKTRDKIYTYQTFRM